MDHAIALKHIGLRHLGHAAFFIREDDHVALEHRRQTHYGDGYR